MADIFKKGKSYRECLIRRCDIYMMCIIVEQNRLLEGLDTFKHKIQVPLLCFVGVARGSVIFTYVLSVSAAKQSFLFLGKILV